MNASDQERPDQDQERADQQADQQADRQADQRADQELAEDIAAAPEPGDPEQPGTTPRQARRMRIAAASVLMAAVAVVLVVRMASRSSVLVVGVYGLLLILCGIVIELSRRGRTRLGSWLLGAGLVAALSGDWLLLP